MTMYSANMLWETKLITIRNCEGNWRRKFIFHWMRPMYRVMLSLMCFSTFFARHWCCRKDCTRIILLPWKRKNRSLEKAEWNHLANDFSVYLHNSRSVLWQCRIILFSFIFSVFRLECPVAGMERFSHLFLLQCRHSRQSEYQLSTNSFQTLGFCGQSRISSLWSPERFFWLSFTLW